MKNLLVVVLAAALVALLVSVVGCGKDAATGAADNSAVLAAAGDVKVTVDEIRAELEHMSIQDRARILGSEEALKKYLGEALLIRMMVAKAKEAGLSTDTEYQYKLRQAEQRTLFTRYQEYWAKQNLLVSDSEVAAFYAAHPEQFKHGRLLEVRAWLTTDKAKADAARAALVGGGNPVTISQQFGLKEQPMPAIIQEEQVANNPLFVQVILKMQDRSYSAPVMVEGKWAIFWRGETVQPKTLTLDEVREQIIDYMRGERFETAFKEYADTLRNQNAPTYTDALFAELGFKPAAATTPAASAPAAAAPATAVPATPAAQQ